MKLKKGISLLLVIVMALSVMSFALPVLAADDTADIAIVAVDSEGNAIDTSTLKAGDTFVANVELSNISSKKFYSTQVVVYYDTSVLQVVNSNGDAVSSGAGVAAFKASPYMYDEMTEKGALSRLQSNVDPAKGLIEYTLAIPTDIASKFPTGFDVTDDNFMVCGIQFKVLKANTNSQLQFAIENESPEFNTAVPTGYIARLGDKEANATITDKTESIYIGEVKLNITEDVTLADTYKAFVGSTMDDIRAVLPAEVTVPVSDGDNASTATVKVEWKDVAGFTGAAGDYTVEGTFTDLPSNITNTANHKAIANVTVAKKEIKSATAITGALLPSGTSAEDAVKLLPAQAEVTFEDDSKGYVPVTWTAPEGYTGEVEEDTKYTFTGAFTLGDKYANTAEVAITAEATVSGKVTADTKITSVAETKLEVAYNTAGDDIMARLPKVIEVTLEGGKKVAVAVAWTAPSGFSPDVPGTYEFTGALTLVDHVLNPDSIAVKANVTVKASEAAVKKIKSVAKVEDVKVEYGTKLDAAVAKLPTKVIVTLEDNSTKEMALTWASTTTPSYSAKKPGTYAITGTITKTDDVDLNGKGSISANIIIDKAGEAESVAIYRNGSPISSLTIAVGTTVQLTVKATPEDPDAKITWGTSSAYIASLGSTSSSTTTVYGRIAGNATITATVGSKTVSIPVYVVSNSGSNSGGTSGPGGSSIIGSPNGNTGDKEEPLNIVFTDLADYPWAAGMISKLAQAGVISGRTSTTFEPGASVTRAEFLSMLVRAFTLTSDNTEVPFSDVGGEWYYDSIRIAYGLGIAAGYEDGSFRPDAQITREEMAALALRAANKAGISIPGGDPVAFTDSWDIADFAKEAIDTMTAAGIINGMGDGTFAPKETANRAQSAVIIYKIWSLK